MGESTTRYCWDESKQDFVLESIVLANLQAKGQLREHERASFLRGPIPMPWLEQSAKLPGKALNAALAVWYAHSITKKATFTVKRKTWERLSLTRWAYYRALRELEGAGLVTVERRPGAYPLITLNTSGVDIQVLEDTHDVVDDDE